MAHNLSRVARAIYLIPSPNSLVTLSSLNALSHMATNCLSSHGAPHPPQIRLKPTKSESLSVGKVYLGPDEAASRKRHPLRPHPQGHGRGGGGGGPLLQAPESSVEKQPMPRCVFVSGS